MRSGKTLNRNLRRSDSKNESRNTEIMAENFQNIRKT